MKSSLLAGCCVVSLVCSGLALWSSLQTPLAPPGSATSNDRQELERLRGQIAALTQRLDAADMATTTTAMAPRSDAMALPPAAPSPVAVAATAPEVRDLLAHYVRSFADHPNGSEYYRLAVDAHIGELAGDCDPLLRDGGRPVPMRDALARMFGKRRFAEVDHVFDALLVAALPPAPGELARTAIEAMAQIASPRAIPGLERIVLARTDAARNQALTLLVSLAGPDANQVLQRLWWNTTDDALRQLLVQTLDGSDDVAALDVLTAAAGGVQPVRLVAARKVGEFDEPGIDALVQRWRPVETDAAVQQALDALANGAEAEGWSAAKATGAPDATPNRDDPNAWAPRDAEMGRQWLQLSYPTAVVAHGVRVFEVNATGAVVEVLAKAPDGRWTSVWRGTTEIAGGSPRLLTWAPTGFAVRTIRLVLDTNRSAGWDEIDAVELLASGGGQWAARATASSTYANRNQGDAAFAVRRDELLLQQQKKILRR
ncbi:MAG: HEAT repeat domain-containing protein [Planctomycetota bacterium]